jgi:hypothetical protein
VYITRGDRPPARDSTKKKETQKEAQNEDPEAHNGY